MLKDSQLCTSENYGFPQTLKKTYTFHRGVQVPSGTALGEGKQCSQGIAVWRLEDSALAPQSLLVGNRQQRAVLFYEEFV